jgi:hypothetical protein
MIDALIEELEKSHKFLVKGVAENFRAVGDDPFTPKRVEAHIMVAFLGARRA